ncbi:MAG: D-2-hydroxyacid dehydrogenase [Bacillota bacterium]
MSEEHKLLLIYNDSFYFTPQQLTTLDKLIPQAEVVTAQNNEVTQTDLATAEIICGAIKVKQVKKTEKLRWLHLPTAGVRGYLDQSIYPSEDVILTNSSGVFGLPIAEHVLGMILAFNRNLHLYRQQQADQEWQRLKSASDFYNSIVGILGLGDIGLEVAQRAQALGAEVLGLKRNPDQEIAAVDHIFGPQQLNQLLQQSDYLVLALPHTAQTEGIIGKEELAIMKDSAYLINVGRGALVDQPALIQALEEDLIAGAGLDVVTPEPLPEDNRLWELDNVILTPHISYYSPTNQQRWFKLFTQNLERYLEGEPLINQVDFKAGY